MNWLLERFLLAPKDKIAFIHKDVKFTYTDIYNNIYQIKEALNNLNIEKGSTIILIADYSPNVFCMLFALASLNCIIVPMTPNTVIDQDEALIICGCDYIINFNHDGITWSTSKHTVIADNILLKDFYSTNTPGLILFSSGSTGKPKGMLHNFNSIINKFKLIRNPIISIPFLMLDHFGGINTILAITSSLGTIVTSENRSLKKICEAISAHKVELLPTTPSFLTLLSFSDIPSKYDLTSLKRITYGTETMPQTTLKRIQDYFPNVEFQQTYGLSEVGVLSSKSKPDGSLWVKIGGKGFETQVRDGILWIRSNYRMVGYLNAPSGFDDNNWFNTQDRVEVDGEYFKILGRVTDLINVGGQKVYPAEVEDVILSQPNIADVVVMGEKNALLGQIVIAKILLVSPELPNELRLRIRRACFAKLTSFKVPVKVDIINNEIYSNRFKKIRS